ncbi:transcriptional activator [Geothermobacter ehrlichii]|uniref:Transcriptional activator n=1 Tax=Geothermobacter ehrlichii TaxID=213224 RepID=A0A5D3WKC4_9BACT|nr:response regulator [Geothermobacter ehrlichii]TYO98804.1 transcriptional activator [Geothermobacter ehrlichii]
MNDQHYTLLLVDDNPTNLALLQELIQQNLPQCTVMVASHGLDALELARHTPPDGALIDMQMPGMDGIEVCRRLKAEPRTAHVAVILITAHQSTPELRAEGLDAGAQDFISQPIRNVELLARIRSLLRIRHVERQLRQANVGLQHQVVRKTAALRWVTGLISVAESDTAISAADTLRQLGQLLSDDGDLDLTQFDGQLFARFPDNLRRTLLKIGLLDSVPAGLAEKLSEIEDVRAALDYLVRHNYFVDYQPARDIYVLHEHFRDYLKGRASRELGSDIVREVMLATADWYLAHDQTAHGLGFLLQAGDFESAERICSQSAPQIYASGGIREIQPQGAVLARVDHGRYPWLGCLHGLLLYETMPSSARESFESARKVFLERGDLAGLVYAGGMLIRICCLADGDFAACRDILAETAGRFSDLDLTGQQHIRIQVSFSLALGALLLDGDFQKADILQTIAIETAQDYAWPEYLVLGRIGRGLLQFYRGSWRSALRELELAAGHARNDEVNLSTRLLGHNVMAMLLEGMGEVLGSRRQRALVRGLRGGHCFEQSLIQPQMILLDVQSELAHGHYEQALEMTDAALVLPSAGSPHMKSQLLQFRSLLSALTGRVEIARADAQKAASLRDEAGGPIYRARMEICLAWSACATGDWELALEWAERGIEDAEQQENSFLLCTGWAVRGLVLHQLGRSSRAVEDFRNCLELMERGAFRNLYGWNPHLMTQLFSTMLRLGVKSETPVSLSRARLYVSYAEKGRPLPTLRFRILGDFSVAVGGRTIHLRDGLTTSLRQLLGLLLVSPGLQLELDEIQHQFWPDSSADQARSRFDSLLTRLRKSLEELMPEVGIKDYLHLRKGVVRLDHCWVDAREFELLVRDGIRHARRMEHLMADQLFRRAHRLWQGEVSISLPNDDGREYYRQDLLLLYFESAIAWMDLLLAGRNWDEVVEVGQRALQFDPINDHVVRRLYLAGLLSGRSHRARQVLRAYEKALMTDGYAREEVLEIIDVLVENCRQQVNQA